MDERIVVVCGAGVAGSAAAAMAAERGAFVLVLEGAPRPYGQVDLWPAWRFEERENERAEIDLALAHPRILFVPKTRVGEDVTLEALFGLGVDLVVLAHGATRPRLLAALADHEGHGVEAASTLLAMHAGRAPKRRMDAGVIVVGEGELAREAALAARADLCVAALAAHDRRISYEALVERGLAALPAELAGSIPPVRWVREHAAPVEADQPLLSLGVELVAGHSVRPILEGERVVGLEVDGARLPCSLVVDATGVEPEPIAGVPQSHGHYRLSDEDTGVLSGLPRALAVGAVAGYGASTTEAVRAHVRDQVGHALEARLGLASPRPVPEDDISEIERMLARPALTDGRVEHALRWARARQAAVGYRDYAAWIGDHR